MLVGQTDGAALAARPLTGLAVSTAERWGLLTKHVLQGCTEPLSFGWHFGSAAMLAHMLKLAALLHEEALLITQPVELFVQIMLLLHEVNLHTASNDR